MKTTVKKSQRWKMTDIRIMAKIAKLENARNENDRQHSKGEIGRQSKERVCFSL